MGIIREGCRAVVFADADDHQLVRAAEQQARRVGARLRVVRAEDVRARRDSAGRVLASFESSRARVEDVVLAMAPSIQARNAAVTGLQNAAADPSNAEAIKELGAAEGTLNGALGRLFALAEAYPDLKANQNMMQFQEELATTENKVAFARQAFNDAVMNYNNGCESFPSSIVANNFNFQTAEFLEIEAPEKREVPKVAF